MYYQQHTALMDAIARRKADAPASELPFLQHIETYASTWIDLDACRLARREIQEDLIRRCQYVERRLGGRGYGGWFRRLHLPSVATTSSCAVFMILAAVRPNEAFSVVSHVRHAVYHFGVMLERTSYTDRLMTGTLVMFLFGWWMLNSMRRS